MDVGPQDTKPSEVTTSLTCGMNIVIRGSNVQNKTHNVRTKPTLRRVRLTILAVEKQYRECVSIALVTQHAKPMRRIIL